MSMVSYWKTQTSVEAKVTKDKQGHTVMIMKGEKYPIMGQARGYLLFGPLSKLKHEVKNQIFNDSWNKLENGISVAAINENLKKNVFKEVLQYLEPMKYDITPPEKMAPAIKEIHRAWTETENKLLRGESLEISQKLKEAFCLVLQDDDSYRFRVSWAAIWFPWVKWFANPVKLLEKALIMAEHAEVIGDMKERVRLWKRILLMMLEDPGIRNCYLEFFKECNWEKVKITEADRYHVRAKYFKADLDVLEY